MVHFGNSQRSKLGASGVDSPGVGAYDLRYKSGVYSVRPLTAPFGAASKRPDMGMAGRSRNDPHPTQYLSHAEPIAPALPFGNTPRVSMGAPNGLPGVGEYSLSKPFFIPNLPKRAPSQSGVTQRTPSSIPSPRREQPSPPSRRVLEEATAAVAGLSKDATGGFETDELALALSLAATAQREPLPDLRSKPRNSATPFSATPRFGSDETTAPGPGYYELDLPKDDRGGIPFAAGASRAENSVLISKTTLPTVGPGTYDFDLPFKFRVKTLPVELQCFNNNTPRDPLDMNLNARVNKNPGVGDYNLFSATFPNLGRSALVARERDERAKAIGARRLAREAELDSQMTRPHTEVGKNTMVSNGLSPRVDSNVESPRAPVRGYAIPAFDLSAVRAGAFGSSQGPGPSDYFSSEKPNAVRHQALLYATQNHGFSTSRRPTTWADAEAGAMLPVSSSPEQHSARAESYSRGGPGFAPSDSL